MIRKDSLKAADRAAGLWGGYVSPEVNVIEFQPEGVLCSSGLTQQFEESDHSDGSFWN